jgi:hypothetical protein
LEPGINGSVADVHGLESALLRGRAPDVLGTRAFWSLANLELDAITLTQILEPLAIHRTLMEKVFVSSIVLDEPEPLVDS